MASSDNLTREQKALILLLHGRISPEEFAKEHNTAQNEKAREVVNSDKGKYSHPLYDFGGTPDSMKQGMAEKIYSNPNHLLGALGAIGATAATGPAAALPLLIAGGLGATASTPGEAAASTALSALPLGKIAGTGSRAMQAIRSLVGGGAGAGGAEALKEVIDNGKVDPARVGTAAGIGGVLGGASGFANAPVPTKPLSNYQQYKQKLAEYGENAASHAEQAKGLKSDLIVAKSAHEAAEDELNKHTTAMDDAMRSAQSQAQKTYQATQKNFRTRIAQHKGDLLTAQQEADQAKVALQEHNAALEAKLKQNQEAANQLIQEQLQSHQDAIAAKTAENARLAKRIGPDGRFIPTAEANKKLANNTAEIADRTAQIKNIKADKVDLGPLGPSDEDAAKTAELFQQHASATSKIDDLQKRLQEVRIAQAQHAEDGLGATVQDSSMAKKAQELQDKADAAAKALREAQLAHDLHMADAPVRPPKVEPELSDRVKEIAKSGIGKTLGVGGAGGAVYEIGKHVGVPAAVLSGGAAATTAFLNSPAGEAFKRALREKLMANAGQALPGVPEAMDNPAVNNLSDRLRTILSSQVQPPSSAPEEPVTQ